MQVTVAICTHNPDRERLRRVIGAVARELGSAPGSELLVVDNNSSPALDPAELGLPEASRLIQEPIPGLTAAREAAITAATRDVIVFIDDDNVITDGYIARVGEVFASRPGVGVVGCGVVPEYECDPPGWLEPHEGHLAIRRYRSGLWVETTGPPYTDFFPMGAGFSVRTEVARRYQQSLHRDIRIEGRRGRALLAGEDLDLDLFALSEGYTLAVDGQLQLIHVIPCSRLDRRYLERMIAGAVQSSVLLERKWAGRFGQPIYPVLHRPLSSLIPRTLALWLLGHINPGHRLRYRLYREILVARLVRRDVSGLGARSA